MAEISNRTLSLLVLATLAVVVTSVVVHFSSTEQQLTGFATSDTGYVNLTINQTLAIAVDATNSTIDFGQCTGYGSSYWCASNDTIVCNNNGFGNCTGDTATPQYIRLNNVGNVDANITIQSECDADTLIGGTSPLFQYITTSCNGTGVSAWTSFSTAPGANVCTNLSYLGGSLQLYANVTIPSNAVGATGACTGAQSTVTFSATQSP